MSSEPIRSTLYFVPSCGHYENLRNTEDDMERNDAGIDLFVSSDTTLEPGKVTMVKYGVSATMMKDGRAIGYQLSARSSISKYGGIFFTNAVGLIDSSFTGELQSALYNPTTEPIFLKNGTKFAQVYDPTTMNRPHLERVESLAETKRGAGGFGSTGH